MTMDPHERPTTSHEQHEDHAQRIVQSLASTLARSSSWMRFVAILTILGAIASLIQSWWNLFLIWLPIWTSGLLLIAANAVDNASRGSRESELERALDRLRLYFKVSGVTLLISLILVVVALFIAIPLSMGM